MSDDIRFDVPLFTPFEAAQHLGIPPSTLRNWLGLDRRPPVVTRVGGRARTREATVPFIGLAEAYMLAAFRATGVSLQRIRPAIERLDQEVGLAHALANRRVMTDGAEILYEFDEDATKQLVVVRNDQVVFREVVEDYLQAVTWAEDDYTKRLRLPRYGQADIVIDPERNFGQPIFDSAGTRLEDVLDLFFAGEPIDVVADEYGISAEQVEAAVRVAGRAVAA